MNASDKHLNGSEWLTETYWYVVRVKTMFQFATLYDFLLTSA